MVTNYGEGGGGLQNGRGDWQVKFYPYKKKGGGGRTSFSHAEGGRGRNSFEVVLTRELEVLAILMRWGGGVVLDTRLFHFVAPPPLHGINDQSLTL